ncbi:SARP family transcriptional regulator [Saccharothrix sp. NRRL B-16348]|nr:SARP family transcriptional regulator [Saccharothrix sp. NRRL B-16348]
MLGAVEVVAGGVPLDVGHARQRDLLAVLLIEAGQVVPIDRLADRAWGAKLPRKPNDALYSYLSRLRTAFRGIDDVTIKRQRGGYSLVVEPRAVDVHRFAWLTGKARAAPDDDVALALFDEALALWRGRALDGLDSPWSDSVRADLDRQRYAAALERNDLRLRTGRHADVLAELADEPLLDERAAAQLVEALQLDGRPADALREYERIRRRLADELGADPGPRLREVHQRILTGEAAGPGMPRQLPAPPSTFTGRTAELAALDDLLAEPGSLVVVTGSGGIGKTWLTLRWAADHVGRFTDGQLYVNLRGFDPALRPVAAAGVLRDFLAALGIAPEFIPPGVEARAAMYRNLSAGRSMLIVLDNARDTAQITPLLPGGSRCSVLVTSRHQLGGLLTTHGARALPVRHLHDGEARALLERRLGAAKLRDDPEAADEIVRHCAGLPLALAIVAARALSEPDLGLAALVSDLRDARLDTLDAGEVPANLRAVFSASYRALDPEAAWAFRLLGLVPGADIGSGAAAALIGAARPLRGLTAANLLRESPPGRLRLHDLVRLYARELADTVDDPGDRKAALDRLFDHYLHTASAAMDLFAVHEPYRRPPVPTAGQPTPSFAGYVQARAWLDAERPALLAMGAHAAAFGHERHAVWLAAVLFRYLDVTAHYEDALALHGNALAFTDPGSLARGIAHHAVGWTLIRLGRADEAADHLRQALSSAQDHRSDLLESAVRGGLAVVHDRSGERSSAREQHELALAAARRAGHVHLEGIALCDLGEHAGSCGDHEEALQHLGESGRIAREIGDGGLAGRIFAALGRTNAGLGRTDEAARQLQRALRFARFGGNTTLEVSALNDLGAVVPAAEALDHHEQALTLAKRIGHRHELARAHRGLAEAHRQLSNHAEAALHAAWANRV